MNGPPVRSRGIPRARGCGGRARVPLAPPPLRPRLPLAPDTAPAHPARPARLLAVGASRSAHHSARRADGLTNRAVRHRSRRRGFRAVRWPRAAAAPDPKARRVTSPRPSPASRPPPRSHLPTPPNPRTPHARPPLRPAGSGSEPLGQRCLRGAPPARHESCEPSRRTWPLPPVRAPLAVDAWRMHAPTRRVTAAPQPRRRCRRHTRPTRAPAARAAARPWC